MSKDHTDIIEYDEDQEERGEDQRSSEGLPPPSPPVPNQPPSRGNEEQHSNRKKSSRLETARFIVELITIGLGVLGFIVLWCTLEATQIAANAAKTQAEAAVSAFAVAVKRQTQRSILFDSGEKERAKQKEVCNGMRTMPNDTTIRSTIMPGHQVVEGGRLLQVKKADLEKGTAQNRDGSSRVMLFIVGCVDYQFTFVEGHHQTGFGFWIWRHDPSFPKRNIVDPTQGIISAEQIRFESMAGDGFAD